MKYYRKEPDAGGSYVDTTGERYEIYACRRHADERGINVGWTPFESLETCLAAWGLMYNPQTEPETIS